MKDWIDVTVGYRTTKNLYALLYQSSSRFEDQKVSTQQVKNFSRVFQCDHDLSSVIAMRSQSRASWRTLFSPPGPGLNLVLHQILLSVNLFDLFPRRLRDFLADFIRKRQGKQDHVRTSFKSDY